MKEQSNQFPTGKPEPKVLQLTYNGQVLCTGNAKLCYGMRANLIKFQKKNYNPKLLKVLIVE
jgi:hypothetical protein